MINKKKTVSLKNLVVLTLLIPAVFSIAVGVKNAMNPDYGSADFQWDASRILLMRLNPYQLTLSTDPAPTDKYTPDKLTANQVPSCLILLWPYAVFDWSTAKVLWLLSNLLFTAILVIYSFKLFFPDAGWNVKFTVLSLFVIGTPWRNLVGIGQHTLFSLAFFVLAAYYSDKKQKFLSGILLGISYFKYTTIFPMLPYFLYKKRYMPIAISFGLHGILHLLASFWLGEWPHTLVFQSLEVSSRHSLNGYIDILAVFSHMGMDLPTIVGLLPALAIMLGTAVIAIKAKRKDDLAAMTLVGMVSIIVVYHRRIYDFVVLLFPLMFVFKYWKKNLLNTLLTLCLGSAFIVDRIFYSVGPKLDGMGLEWIENIYFYIFVTIWYSSIAVCGARLLHSENAES